MPKTHWLKLGYHDIRPDADIMAEEIFIESFLTVKERFDINDADNTLWSNILRLHCWKATDKRISFLREQGIIELLTANDETRSYNLTYRDCNMLKTQNKIVRNGMTYRRSSFRYEQVINIEDELNKVSHINNIVVFTHEWCFEKNMNLIEESFEWFVNKGYSFYNIRRT